MNGDQRRPDDGMDNDYLWDRRGPVELEVARLERLLRGHAHDVDAQRRSPRAVAVVPARARRRA